MVQLTGVGASKLWMKDGKLRSSSEGLELEIFFSRCLPLIPLFWGLFIFLSLLIFIRLDGPHMFTLLS